MNERFNMPWKNALPVVRCDVALFKESPLSDVIIFLHQIVFLIVQLYRLEMVLPEYFVAITKRYR